MVTPENLGAHAATKRLGKKRKSATSRQKGQAFSTASAAVLLLRLRPWLPETSLWVISSNTLIVLKSSPELAGAPKPPVPPNENPPVAGFDAAGVLKAKPPDEAPNPPAAGAAAPKGLELGVPKALVVVEAPKGDEPPKAGVLEAPKMLLELAGAPKAKPPNAGCEAGAARLSRKRGSR
jgi:hypothetical protein